MLIEDSTKLYTLKALLLHIKSIFLQVNKTLKMKYAILYHSGNSNSINSLKSILDQKMISFDLCIAGKKDEEAEKLLENFNGTVYVSDSSTENYPDQMQNVVDKFDGDYLLYVDNREKEISLKNTCLKTFAIAAERNPDASMFYADYDLIDGDETKEIKLLFHHIGRVRDNQDYGSVYLISKKALKDSDGFDPAIKYNNIYDLRLKLSEQGKLIRIGNKYNGSLYSVVAPRKSANVFDYLLAGKEVQEEAERVVTEHLKRIGAYLAPDAFAEKKKLDDFSPELEASVIIPVGYRPEFIGTAIDSIQDQTIKNIEAIIVVNGGVGDPTADEVRRYMEGGDKYDPNKPTIRLIEIDVNNIGLCLNIGSQYAKGKYYVQLDSDDRLKADAVEKIKACFESDPDIGMVIGSYEVWEQKKDGKLYRMEDIPVVTHDEWTPENGRNNLLRINGAGAPRSVPIPLIKAMGYFSINDDAFARNYGEDYEMVNKISEHYKIGRIYDPIYEVVRHAGGTDHAISQELIDRNDEAKDDMRKEAILRRIEFNKRK